MWSAIKSDLLNFVTTIQEDTTKTISKVLGDEEEDDDGSVMQEKVAADVRRSFETYGTIIKESNLKEFNRFKKTFSLGQYANDIGFVLDEEPEVSRFYAELVPAQISPEEFWARLFFRLNKVYRSKSANGSLEDDEDEEEELVWDAHDDDAKNDTADNASGLVASTSSLSLKAVSSVHSIRDGVTSSTSSAADNSEANSALAVALRRVAELETENNRMKGQIRSLVGRVSELETSLQKVSSQSQAVQPNVLTSTVDISTATLNVNTNQSVASPAVSDSDASIDQKRATPHSPPHQQVVVEPASSDAVSRGSRTSSSDSGVVVESNLSDTMSYADEGSAHGVGSDHDSLLTSSASVVNSSTGGLSAQTTQFLPAVDDEDDEENGWN